MANPVTPEDPGATPLGNVPFLFFGVLITGYLVTKKCSFFGRILARSYDRSSK